MSLTNTNPATDLAARRPAAPLAANEPTPDELAVLSRVERVCFRVAHRMNQGRWKRLWTFCQRAIGAGWIRVSTYNLMRVYGLEHLPAIDPERPLLIVANHRSFFDLYVVATALFHRAKWRRPLIFPVRSELFYDSLIGLFVNFIMGWFSMYPPFFKANEKRAFDKYSMRRLTEICREGRGYVIGFHPEGKRNFDPDPYTLLPAQPGLGMLVKQAQPQVLPVFVAGLSNDLPQQVMSNWRGGEKIRVHFGPPLDLSEFYAMKDHVRTYKAIGEFVMAKIGELGEADRLLYGKNLPQINADER
jgi:1-acyl-sn-glycerol-3-phosphate acyltransferase